MTKTLYIIGGSARTGKTTTFNQFKQEKDLVAISIDKVRAGVRNLLFDQSAVSVKNLSFQGQMEYKVPGTTNYIPKKFSKKKNDNQLTWDFLKGFIEAYDRDNDISVIIEGDILTPQMVSTLKLKYFNMKVVFLGYTNISHAQTIFRIAKENKRDWINIWLEEEKGNPKKILNSFRKEVVKAKRWKEQCKKLGYGFFDISEYTKFEEYVNTIVKYLSD